MAVTDGNVFLLYCIPLRTFLRICASAVFVALILMPCLFFLNVGLPSKFYQISNEASHPTVKATLPLKTCQISNETSYPSEVKTILYWTKMFYSKTFYLGEGDIFQHCEISACQATYDRNFMRIEDFDALLFHGIEIKASDLPRARSAKQKYIFVDLESPGNQPLNSASSLNEFYNWTMTYRRDSDIPRTYGYIIDSVTNDIVYPLWAGTNAVANHTASENINSPRNNTTFEGKQKAVAWFVSHCNTRGLRDSYVAQLKKYIDVDVYGECGTLSCPNSGMGCYEMLESSYYFYLSFENSLCQDYVTEKLYKVMAYNVVPIVYGGANYTEFTPPGSCINVVDFRNPQHLAEHLHYLMSNPDEYAKFFWWKEHYVIDLSHRISVCQMCKMLHNEKSLASSNISDLRKWWSEGRCQNSEDFLKKITQY